MSGTMCVFFVFLHVFIVLPTPVNTSDLRKGVCVFFLYVVVVRPAARFNTCHVRKDVCACSFFRASCNCASGAFQYMSCQENV